jgi:uncharacterized protein (DUF1800 family)
MRTGKMKFRSRMSVAAAILALSIASPTFPQEAAKKKPVVNSTKKSAPEPGVLTDRERTLHALNRLTFGPRVGDVEAGQAKGLDSWIEDQLHPESIDDSALNARLGPYATTRLNPQQLAQAFPSDNVIRQVISGKRPMPTDPELKLIYSVNVARINQQQAAKTAAAAPAQAATQAATQTANQGMTPSMSPGDMKSPDMSAAAPPSPDDQARALADHLLSLPKEQRLAALESAPPDELVNFPNHLRGDQRDRLNADFSPHEKELFRALASPTGVVTSELQQAKITREIYSQRQLLEVMTDFWFNHFNVLQNKDQCTYYTTAYERDVIRPRAFGKFYDLLVAVAQSPAMLAYLDNGASIGPHSAAAGKNGQSGLNENYGREAMELHTLGVDGGYGQSDVTQLATVFTGWTIGQPDDGGQFVFDLRRHEPGTKIVLGQKFYDAGVDEGLRALDMLAHQPATAHFISKSIAERFVSDDPPGSLVDRMAATFQSTDGDIREVLRTMLRSPEFWSPKAYRAKLKTPLEFVISAVRASGANVVTPDALIQNLNAMGMQPYGSVPPTGYSMKAETWENEGALLARFNFAMSLAQGKLAGVQFDPAELVATRIIDSASPPTTKVPPAIKYSGLDAISALVEDAILHGELSAEQEATIRSQLLDPDVQRRMAASPMDGLRLVVGFTLGSPEFQRR